MTPAVSVVMAVHNGLRFLPAQVDSVLFQLHAQDELVVVDDASTDGSCRWLESIGDARIRLYRNPANVGVRASFERGLGLAQAPIVFLCDQDDIWLPGKRDAFVDAFASDAGVAVVVSDAELVDALGHVTAPSFMARRGGFRGSWWSTLARNRFLGCAMAVRRELLRAALPIPPQVPMHDMWIGALGSLLGSVHYIPTPLLQYRRHGGNASPLRRGTLKSMVVSRVSLGRALLSRLVAVRFGHDGLASTRDNDLWPTER